MDCFQQHLPNISNITFNFHPTPWLIDWVEVIYWYKVYKLKYNSGIFAVTPQWQMIIRDLNQSVSFCFDEVALNILNIPGTSLWNT